MHDDENLRFYGKNGVIELTKMDNTILKELIKNKGKLVTFECFCKLIYQDILDCCYETNIRINIFRLRKKLKNELYIQNIRGKGYRIL